MMYEPPEVQSGYSACQTSGGILSIPVFSFALSVYFYPTAKQFWLLNKEGQGRENSLTMLVARRRLLHCGFA